MRMAWYIVYKGKSSREPLTERLARSGVEYYLPRQSVERLADNQMKVADKEVMRNLIFVNTDEPILSVVRAIDGLRAPYIDRATGSPAVVSDAEMRRFMAFMEARNMDVRLLSDSYDRFKVCQRVRVRAGDFEGTEGFVLRIRGDRKLVISVGNVAVAISGIHHTLLEPVD